MEWVSHTTTAFFLGQLVLKEDERPKRAGWWWAIASVSPDWLEWGTRWFGDIHRGVTHSLYVWPFLALAWAVSARKWGRQETGQIAGLGMLWFVFFVIVGSHMLLDTMMAYRWYLAWPFSQKTWAWGIMPLFDIYILIGWLCLLWVNRRWRLTSANTARLGLAIFALMFTLRSVGKIRAINLAHGDPRFSASSAIATRPTYYTPWIWFVRDEGGASDWIPLNVVTGEAMSDYTRGRGFPPLPGQELIKLPTK